MNFIVIFNESYCKNESHYFHYAGILIFNLYVIDYKNEKKVLVTPYDMIL